MLTIAIVLLVVGVLVWLLPLPAPSVAVGQALTAIGAVLLVLALVLPYIPT